MDLAFYSKLTRANLNWGIKIRVFDGNQMNFFNKGKNITPHAKWHYFNDTARQFIKKLLALNSYTEAERQKRAAPYRPDQQVLIFGAL